MAKIIYDLTYAARGNSRIPKDTRSVAEVLESLNYAEVDYVISSKHFVSRYSLPGSIDEKLQTKQINNIFSTQPKNFLKKLFAHPSRSILQSVSLFRNIRLKKITLHNVPLVLEKLSLSLDKGVHPTISILQISYAARFARPKIFGLFRLDTAGADFYIQQQIDPIKVSVSTTHIVRLHDILPITHPQFFSTRARIAFNRGLTGLLSNKNIVWVMDTEASKKEFMSYFGNKLRVEVIPCEVGYGLNPPTVPVAKENRKNNTFLTVNTIEPRKNVRLIVESFLRSQKLDNVLSDDELIIAGSYGWLEEDLMLKLRSGYFGPQVKFIEKPDEAQITRLYESSDFVISASEAEGFGLPPLEGILFGCLPLVSKLPQHFETMGTEAIYFDLNEESLSQAIFSARSLSISKRRELALTLHKHVRSKFSHEVLKMSWESLLISIKGKSFGIREK